MVEPGCTARITQYGDVEIMVSKCFSGIKYAFQLHNFMLQVGQDIKRHLGPELDTIRLSVFSHRFMSIAEQMGRYVYFPLLAYSWVVFFTVILSPPSHLSVIFLLFVR